MIDPVKQAKARMAFLRGVQAVNDTAMVAGDALTFGAASRLVGRDDDVRAANERLGLVGDVVETGSELAQGGALLKGGWAGLKAVGGAAKKVLPKVTLGRAAAVTAAGLGGGFKYANDMQGQAAPALPEETRKALANPGGRQMQAMSPKLKEAIRIKQARQQSQQRTRNLPNMNEMLASLAEAQGGKISINQLQAFNEMANKGRSNARTPYRDVVMQDAHQGLRGQLQADLEYIEANYSGKERLDAIRKAQERYQAGVIDLAGAADPIQSNVANTLYE